MQLGKITKVPFYDFYSGAVRNESEDDKIIDSLCEAVAKEFLKSVKPEVLKVLTENVGPIAAKYIHTEGGRITTGGVYSQALNIEVSLHHVRGLMEQFMESVSFEIKDLGEKKC